MKKLLTREVRKWIYGVSVAFIPVAVSAGWLELEAAALIVPLIVALLNLTPKDIEEQ